MKKGIILLALFIASYSGLFAKGHSITDSIVKDRSHLRISLLIGGPGEELWETFGHSCIRVIDSTKNNGERDVIYNYGFFDGTRGNIGYQFLSGRVLVFLDTITYDEIIFEYNIKKRRLTEQVFLLDDAQKERIVAFLKNNLRNTERYYEYDTFFDNCTTRINDLLIKIFGSSYKPGKAISENSHLTFRNVSFNRYCPEQNKPWFQLGLNIFYAGRIDKAMTNAETMCLPDYLSECMNGATINGRKLSGDKTVIKEEKINWTEASVNPSVVFLIISLLTIIGLVYKRFAIIGNVMSYSLLILTGLLGCFILYTWFLDGEPSWKNNLNILWALPTNIIAPFLKPRAKVMYSSGAICLIVFSVMVNILSVQVMPLTAIIPLLLALLWIYAVMYRQYQSR